MTLCRSRGEPGGARHRDEQFQCRLRCSVRRSCFVSGVRSRNSVCRPLQGERCAARMLQGRDDISDTAKVNILEKNPARLYGIV
jgi:hypothetical protein